jgi:hypothetical protein
MINSDSTKDREVDDVAGSVEEVVITIAAGGGLFQKS